MSESLARASLLLAGLPSGARVLEVSADGGARARLLLRSGVRPTALRHTQEEVDRLRREGLEALALDPPPGDALVPFDAAVLALSLGRTADGSHWVASDPGVLVARVAALLRPGGSLVLALANPLLTLPGVARLVGRLGGAAAPPPPSGERAAPAWRLLDVRSIRAMLVPAGFGDVRVFAALPGGERPKFLLPLGEPALLRYFFTHLVPRPKRRRDRAAVRLASLLPSALFERLVPAYAVSARKESSS